MNLADHVKNEQCDELPTDDDPVRTWLAIALMGCMLVILVMGAIAAYRNVMNEKPVQSDRFGVRAIQSP